MEKISLIGAILLLAGITQINGGNSFPQINGRLLTPEEGCGYSKVKNTRIIGGSEAKIGAWPWMALLGYWRKNKINFDCGGSLITSKHVLTAAHCISEDLELVRLAEHDLRTADESPHQDIPVADFIEHEEYRMLLKTNDIAVVILESDVEFSDHIRPICLPIEKSLRSRKFVGDTPFVAGWGDTEETGSPAQALMQLQVPVVDNTVCRKKAFQAGAKYADYQIKNHVICADAFEGRRFWSGDSGSPLMLPVYQNESHSNPFPFYQIGLVSYSYEFEDVVVPDVFTRVTYFVDWIAEQIEKK